jgi:hypothetical protein
MSTEYPLLKDESDGSELSLCESSNRFSFESFQNNVFTSVNATNKQVIEVARKLVAVSSYFNDDKNHDNALLALDRILGDMNE